MKNRPLAVLAAGIILALFGGVTAAAHADPAQTAKQITGWQITGWLHAPRIG